jgi:hypothetical protein
MRAIVINTIILSGIFLFFYGKCYSQNDYRTTNGYVLATGFYIDSTFIAESHELAIKYNPSDKTIYGNINLQSFTSGLYLIDSLLTSKAMSLTMKGYIPVDFLTWNHSEYNFDIPLEIEFNQRKIITVAKMKFSHIDKLLNYTCVMEASFKLKLSDFDINIPEQVGQDINVQFFQLILRRAGK